MSDWFLCEKWFLEFPYGKSFVTLTAGPCSEAIGEVTRRHIRGWWQIVPKKHFLTSWVSKHYVCCSWCDFIVVWWNFHFLKQSHNLPDIALEGAKNCRSCEELAFSFSHSPSRANIKCWRSCWIILIKRENNGSQPDKHYGWLFSCWSWELS